MNGDELRAIRLRHGLSQQQFGQRLGYSPGYVGLLERGAKPVNERVAQMARALAPPPLSRVPRTNDPMERLIAEALIAAGIPYCSEVEAGNNHRLDFYLPDQDISIEVKRFYSERSDKQLQRTENVILVQGEKSVRALATMIRASGSAFLMSA